MSLFHIKACRLERCWQHEGCVCVCVHGRALGWSPAAGPSLVCFNIAAAAVAALLLASGHHANPRETQRKHRQRGGERRGGMRQGSGEWMQHRGDRARWRRRQQRLKGSEERAAWLSTESKTRWRFWEMVGPTLSHATRVNGFFSQEEAQACTRDDDRGGSQASKSSCRTDRTIGAERQRVR